MRNGLFPAAAEGLERDIQKVEKKCDGRDEERLATALESVREAEIPETLLEAAEEISLGAYEFHAQESQHLRLVAITDVSADRLATLLRLGEQVIDDFRSGSVDPYLDEDFVDQIPDEVALEMFLGPDEAQDHSQYVTRYYGLKMNTDSERALNSGRWQFRRESPQALSIWRYRSGQNLEGLLVHAIGHMLCAYHYGTGIPGRTPQPWLSEALGYSLSLAYLGGNFTSCYAEDQNRYSKPPRSQEYPSVLGLRPYLQELALEQGTSVDALVIRPLSEFRDADLAKAWSLFEFVDQTLGRDGQVWLRAACGYGRKPATMLQNWRPDTETLFDVDGGDVFRVVDEQWREFAQAESQAFFDD
jgi:hypothetical protein